MDDEQIQRIATEPSETQKERTRLNEELDKLRRGRQTLDAYKQEEVSLPKPPILDAQQTPAKNTAQGLPPVTDQKTQFAQSSLCGPPPSGKMVPTAIFGSAAPAPSSQPSKYPPSSPFAAPTGQGGATPKGFAFNNVTPGGSSLFGKSLSPSPSQPKSGVSSPPARVNLFGTSSAAPSGAGSGGSETSPSGLSNHALKNDATKPPKTQGFTNG
ncbi:hypothetical protein PENSUB_9192 [Penicillium subrubescens]|uniref:GED domain-containing protein n=1 Tax=Penicillium subrubescens TaxID=1316194 RepID=A0A1Q5TE60_9EURO|nr:hypothetical protein PENSUB_9192 [Penicillium subrubescens]